MREFNDRGTCIPKLHYMVDIIGKLEEILPLIEKGSYFTINRPRQYGKTTTLFMLQRYLLQTGKYEVFKLSFEGLGDLIFSSEELFVKEFLNILAESIRLTSPDLSEYMEKASNKVLNFRELSKEITKATQKTDKKFVLMIDEVDKHGSNQIFVNLLGMLRSKYLAQLEGSDKTFHSVILAGVHDIKNIKSLIRVEEAQKFNSPWNIAIDFKVDMSFTIDEISDMLKKYADEKKVSLDVDNFSEKIYFYTSGYPYLVSKLCKIIDEEIMENYQWEIEDLDEAMKRILKERNTNFQSLIKNLENNQEIFDNVYDIVLMGIEKTYNEDNPIIELGITYGIFKNQNGIVKVHNRIYEQRIYNYMSSKIETMIPIESANYQNKFVKNGYLDFEQILLKFRDFMKEQYSKRDQKFLERNCRLVFLAFIKPIINGRGFDFKEVQVSEEKRLDIVITYLNRKYVVELKIWKGKRAHKDGINQLADYLDRQGLNKGYLVIFDFTKTNGLNLKQEETTCNGKEFFSIWV